MYRLGVELGRRISFRVGVGFLGVATCELDLMGEPEAPSAESWQVLEDSDVGVEQWLTFL